MIHQRLTRSQRIKKADLFKRIFKKGRSARGKLLHVWIYEGPEFAGAGPHLGLIVSRKIHRLAVVRNRWKRRVREAFRLNQDKIRPQAAVLVLPQKINEVPARRDMEAEFLKLVQRAKGLR